MKTLFAALIVGVLMAGGAGCDREISHTERTKVRSDGTVKKEEQTVTEKPDGTTVKEERKSVDR